MTANPDLVLAGVGAGGSGGTSLAWFGPLGTPLPTSASASLNSAFLDAGYITEDGLTREVEEDSSDVPAYGVSVPVRTLTNSSKVTFQLTFLQTGPVSLAVYHRLPLDAADLIPDANGAMDFTEGTSRTIKYAAVFDITDGDNRYRMVCPSLQVTDREGMAIKAGEPITYGVTLTAYPGSDGVAVHHYVVLDDLAEEAS